MEVLADEGYDYKNACRKWQAADGGHATWSTQMGYCFTTKDGALYKVTLNNSNGIRLNQWLITVDVNGKKLPNRWGKDIYMMTLSNYSLRFFSYSSKFEDIKENCKNGNHFACGWVIQTNGWQFPEDYFW